MPVIELTAGKLSKEQKKELVKSLAEVSSRITGTPIQMHTVLIRELEDDAMSVGTKTVEEIKQEMKK